MGPPPGAVEHQDEQDQPDEERRDRHPEEGTAEERHEVWAEQVALAQIEDERRDDAVETGKEHAADERQQHADPPIAALLRRNGRGDVQLLRRDGGCRGHRRRNDHGGDPADRCGCDRFGDDRLGCGGLRHCRLHGSGVSGDRFRLDQLGRGFLGRYRFLGSRLSRLGRRLKRLVGGGIHDIFGRVVGLRGGDVAHCSAPSRGGCQPIRASPP